MPDPARADAASTLENQSQLFRVALPEKQSGVTSANGLLIKGSG
mgnify:CR=1 FL=1